MRGLIDRDFSNGELKPTTKDQRMQIDTILNPSQEYFTGLKLDDAMNEILSIDMILLVLRSKHIHMNLQSDFETKRTKKYFNDFLVKHKDCHEVLFGLA